MDLGDVTLLRGWINHLDWPVLDDQLEEGSEPAKKRVRRLRRRLAAKAQFYGKQEQIGLWLGERGTGETWQRRCLKSLGILTGLPDPMPGLGQGVGLWFPDTVCAALPHKVQTLADLLGFLESAFAGDAEYPKKLKPSLKILTRFFDDNALALGVTLNRKPASALPTPLRDVAPLERVLIPAGLDGEHGSNRSPEPSRINAKHDLDAIHSWLSLKDGNLKTYQAYKKELERMLLWAVLERGKALSSLNTDDCKAYVHFLKTLTTADLEWATLAPAIKGQGNWKPFTYRIPKKRGGPTEANQETQKPALVLSPRSVNYAKTIISSCMDWLVKQQYLKHNNFDGIASIKFAQAKTQAGNRAFTLKQMQTVFAYAEAKVDPESPEFADGRRTLFILKLAFSTGLRIHELAAASFGDVECLDGDAGEQYFLRVVGKNSKERKTSLPQRFIEELRDYLKLRGLPSHFDFLPQQAPLIPSLRDKTGRKHLSPAGLHKVLATFFEQMSGDLESGGNIDPRLADKLRKASAHWLRHSYGSYLANDRQVPLAYIRDELGHANISTTSLYLNTDAKQRQKVVSDAFSGV
ncbi:MAG: site-specific integrase [Methyloglobulus sp.]|nr:site-specific integrase [Methyloglobulus sp.]